MTDDSGGDGSDGSDGGQVVERKAAEEAFELLSNDTRLGILKALFQTDDPRTFSELREAVGMRDSGQFNYHLDKLLGTFVRVTEGGYELTTAGTRVVGAILAGEFTKTFEGDPVPVDGECQLCGARLAGTFEGSRIRIACEDCERDVISLNMLPGALEPYPREEWPLVAERWTRRELEMVRAGFCPTCRGPVDSEMRVDQSDLVDLFEAVVTYTCRRCTMEMSANAATSVVPHPAVVGFLHDHGVDVGGTPLWKLEWAVSPTGRVVSSDPVRVEIPIEADGDRLVLVLDGHASVIDERREEDRGAPNQS